jgi:hypothetical protein
LNTCFRKLTVHIVPAMPLPGIHWKSLTKCKQGKTLGNYRDLV